MIKGIIFDNQIPTAKGIRGGFHSALTDGILDGCEIRYSGKNVIIGAGLMVVAGGIFAVSGNETITINATSGYARVKAILDLSKPSSPDAFGQIRFEADTATAPNLFPILTQEKVNTGTGVIYQAEICVVSLNINGVADIVRYSNASPRIAYGDTLPSDAAEGTIFLLKTT